MRNFLENTFFQIFFVGAVFATAMFWPVDLQAEFSVSPVVIDEKGEPRDTISRTITLTNNSSRQLSLYAFVNNVSVDGADSIEEFRVRSDEETDITRSLANWISVTRGAIELPAGESKEIDISIGVNLRAQPGKYHAVVFFADGNRRSQAEERITRDRSVIIGLEVEEDIDEFLELRRFSADKNVFGGPPITFSYTLENKGNVPVSPRGFIRIYNRNGEEVGEITIPNDTTIAPEEEEIFIASLDQGIGMGRFRARLDLEYGGEQRLTLSDTTFFHSISFVTLGIVFFVSLAVVLWLAHIAHKRHERRHQRMLTEMSSVREKPSGHSPEADDPHVVDLRKK